MGVTVSPPGHALLVRAPPELGGLVPLRQKAVDGPRVDEHARGLRAIRDLRVALGDVHTLDAEVHGEPCPSLPRLGNDDGGGGVGVVVRRRGRCGRTPSQARVAREA